MAAGQDLAADVDGLWLFKHGDLVLGPVSGTQIVEKLTSGELTLDTLVAPAGERDFHRMSEVDAFRVHVARAEARARVDAAVVVERAKSAKRLKILGGAAAAGVVVLGIFGVQVARNVAVHGWSGDGEVQTDDFEMGEITIRVAQARVDEEELFEYPGHGARRPGTGEPGVKPAAGSSGPGKVAMASTTRTPVDRRPRPGGSVTTDPEGMEMTQQFDQSAINRVVASNKSTLFRCFKEEAERTPGLYAKVPMEFVIGNDGRVSKLWVDNHQFKKGPLYECLLAEMKKWPFRAYEGEQATVGLSFTIGKRG
ncbi:AgmX/PglI C-terminal domain-containing protein [Myxococcus vastator]|uniref:AgmX/PglI C-terminal domain-containing protein n=1 Tax=Myxococcus vastator TaxID=2709664 RepID=UPI00196780CB|nr:AgmX/PglI C-terminal domain-containing protein [Myxococcus vastator]